MAEVGAWYNSDQLAHFRVWAPESNDVRLHLVAPEDRIVPMTRCDRGYWETTLEGLEPGARYFFQPDGHQDRPDPASRSQPEGVHGPSELVGRSTFRWSDRAWKGVPLEEMIQYELHIGAFTDAGTFDAAIERLDDLRDLGVNAIELLPVAQNPGERNWGYDGVYPYAVQKSYGGGEGLKRLVDACHSRGIAVILDVVYNHMGPEGNYLGCYGPYFTDRYRTPWGQAMNFDGAGSNEVRNFFIENALYWLRVFHIDALRLDATHAIFDINARPFLQELAERVREFGEHDGRPRLLIAESDLNDARILRPLDEHGLGMDAQWSDDFHHIVHALTTGERDGYYMDFHSPAQFAKALSTGYVYTGDHSEFRNHNHGRPPIGRPGRQFVVCVQNHDQVGNRATGERFSHLLTHEGRKLAAGCMLISPFVPMLFMGEEYAEDAPFLYFVNHSDANLIEAVRNGRREEFESFDWQGEVPDPQAEETFELSKLNWKLRGKGEHKLLLDFYRELIALRRGLPALSNLEKESVETTLHGDVVEMTRLQGTSCVKVLFNFSQKSEAISIERAPGRWMRRLDSAADSWGGTGATALVQWQDRATIEMPPQSLALYVRTKD
ncbi:malto-oligosyltrehalose trehalohydrolase [bacterium]|nr:malto-oligosyltrehalose trehalohydrolase [bacterium]